MRKNGIKHSRTSTCGPPHTGVLADDVGESGVNFYEGLFKTILEAGITPSVTLNLGFAAWGS